MSGGVANGQYANEDTFNGAFFKKTADEDSIIAKTSLINELPESGDPIVNVQKAVNKIFGDAGIDGENDANALVYGSHNVLTDGDNHKEALEKLDAEFSEVITSLTKLGDTPQYGAATVEAGAGISITRTGNNYKFDNNLVIVSSSVSLNGSSPLAGTGRRRLIKVQSSSGVVDMSAQGIEVGLENDELFILGVHADNVVVFKSNSTVDIDGDWYSLPGNTLHLICIDSKWQQFGRRG